VFSASAAPSALRFVDDGHDFRRLNDRQVEEARRHDHAVALRNWAG
jgi:hypothetical protein